MPAGPKVAKGKHVMNRLIRRFGYVRVAAGLATLAAVTLFVLGAEAVAESEAAQSASSREAPRVDAARSPAPVEADSFGHPSGKLSAPWTRIVDTGGRPWDWGDAARYAVDQDDDRTQAICRSVRSREPPTTDAPDAEMRVSLRGCRSEALYYGIGMTADPVRARLCAFVEAEAAMPEEPFHGRGMLMTIYANGVGAARDLDVATHLACGLNVGTADMVGRIDRLSRLQAENWAVDDFDFCDDTVTDPGMFACAAREARRSRAGREATVRAISLDWTVAERQRLSEVERLFESYLESQVAESWTTGTLDNMMQHGIHQSLRDEHTNMLGQLAAGEAVPQLAGLAGQEERLHRARLALEASFREREFTSRPADAGDQAQQAWLDYRDAFLELAETRFPEASRDGLAAWLTAQRADLLEETLRM